MAEEIQPTPKRQIPKCEMCERVEAKYKCPRCMIRTCSLPCILKHKIQHGCRGERNKTAYIALKAFTDENLHSDLHFLEEGGRKAELTKKEKLKYQHKALSFRLKALTANAQKRGVDVVLMSDGMSRHSQNTSMYHFRSKTIHWRVEWIFPHEHLTFIDTGFSDVLPIQDGVDTHLQQGFPKTSQCFQTSLTQHQSVSSCSPASELQMSKALKLPSKSPLSQTLHDVTTETVSSALDKTSTEITDCPSAGDGLACTACPADKESAVSDLSKATACPVDEEPILSDLTKAAACPVDEEITVTACSSFDGESSSRAFHPESTACPVDEEMIDTAVCSLVKAESALIPSLNPTSNTALGPYSAEGGRQYRVFLAVHGLEARNKRYYELDKTLSLGKNLKGKRIFEFPTLYIVPEHCTHSYPTLSADEENELRKTSLSVRQSYSKRHLLPFRGGRRRRRPQYQDADTYNPNSKIYAP